MRTKQHDYTCRLFPFHQDILGQVSSTCSLASLEIGSCQRKVAWAWPTPKCCHQRERRSDKGNMTRSNSFQADRGSMVA
eukprot:scaffold345_cov134-Cylindrotheca_fusiformis.AAC.4